MFELRGSFDLIKVGTAHFSRSARSSTQHSPVEVCQWGHMLSVLDDKFGMAMLILLRSEAQDLKLKL